MLTLSVQKREMTSVSMERARALFSTHSELIGRSVCVYFLRDETFVSGVLYAIDPENGDVALLQSTRSTVEGAVAVKIIMGHAVDKLVLDESCEHITLDSLNRILACESIEPESKKSAVAAAEVTRRLQRFLDERFIPHARIAGAQHDGVSVFGGSATLRFPFDAKSVDCANEQILRRLQALLDDFQRSCEDR